MANKTTIANLALSHLGHGIAIANIETETSAEALACKTQYDIVKDICLTEGEWKFAIKEVVLGLVEIAPTIRWAYSYRLPNNCLSILRVLSKYRADSDKYKIEYKESSDASGSILYTDEEAASIEYICSDPAETATNSYYDMALSFLLAAHIAPTITAGDTFGLQERMLANYGTYINKSKEKEATKTYIKEADGTYLAARDM